MTKEKFSYYCQNCGGHLKIEKLSCSDCEITLQGTIDLPRLARLDSEDRKFIELFVLSAGSLKEVGRSLKKSYPTVRLQLDRVIASLQALNENKQTLRLEIIKQIENKTITAEEAAKRLSKL